MLVRLLPAVTADHLVLCAGNGNAELQCMQQSFHQCCLHQTMTLCVACSKGSCICSMSVYKGQCCCMSRLLTASGNTVYLYAGSSKSSTGHAAEASRQSSCCSTFHAASRAGPRSSPRPFRGRSFCTTCHVSFPARHLCPLKLLHLSDHICNHPYRYNADVASTLQMQGK